MANVIPRASELDALKYLTNSAVPEVLVLRLFSNDITPAQDDTAASYTEVTGGDYAGLELTNWNDPVAGSGAAPSTITHPTATFTFSAGVGVVYGYYMTRRNSGTIALASRFDAPVTISTPGSSIEIDPQISAN